MIVGMTGARAGMTRIQRVSFLKLLVELEAVEFHHGDCLGADVDGHWLAYNLGLMIIVHPPTEKEDRAYLLEQTVLESAPALERNRDIVDASDVLIATPATPFETEGGTWYTINYARQGVKPVYIINPDGSVLQTHL